MNLDRETIAAVQHEIWAHWIRYHFRVSQKSASGTFIIPVDKVKRWQRQMEMPYSELSEEEKESDRHQADKVIAAIRTTNWRGMMCEHRHFDIVYYKDGILMRKCQSCGQVEVHIDWDWCDIDDIEDAINSFKQTKERDEP